MDNADGLKVLLVDDDPAMQRLVATWTAKAGYAITCASNAHDAMDRIREDCPQFLITDWDMPGTDGIGLCKWLRSQDLPHYVYTVLLTVRAGTDDIVEALEAGADTFLRKPVDHHELLARMRCGIRVLQLENRLKELANCDALTGLATQRTLYERMKSEWSRAQRHYFALSSVMLDIDYFKRINDVYGHAVGDKVICAIGKVLADNCRKSDVVSRYGGEEFCVFLPETDEHHATLWADRIRAKIAALEFPIDDQVLKVTASFGVAERQHETATPEELVDMADQALLVAKRSGRDRVVNYRTITEGGNHTAEQLEAPSQLLTKVLAKHVMTTVVTGLNQDAPVSRATRYFLRFRVSSAPVVDHQGQLVGMLSEKDILAIMLDREWWKKRIRDVMKQNVVCYDENTPALAIYDFLCRVSMRAVVVVRDGIPLGTISRGSILRWFTNALIANVEGEVHSDDPLVAELGGLSYSLDPEDRALPAKRMTLAAAELAREAGNLNRRIHRPDLETLPCIVSGASLMQALIDDLLCASRIASQPRNGSAVYQPTPADCEPTH